MNREEADREDLHNAVKSKIQAEDVIHKAMLRPTQVLLRTNLVDETVALGELAQGLKQAVKARFLEDSYDAVQFKPFVITDGGYKDIKSENMDNIISYLKSRQEAPGPDILPPPGGNHLELAICVCMYSEDKRMLKDTMKGIEDNVERMLRAGMNPDSIAVVIMMDGIEKVDDSVVSYFQELERESGIYLGPRNNPSYSKEDIEKQIDQEQRGEYSVQKITEKNRNSFLFSPPELQDRQARRFEPIRKQYLQYRDLRHDLLELRSKSSLMTDNLYDHLPPIVQREFFYKAAVKHKLRTVGSLTNRDQWAKEEKKQLIVEEYTENKELSRQISLEAINTAIAFLDKFFSTRQDLSYLGSYRKKIYFKKQPPQMTEENPNDMSYYNLTEQEQYEYREMNVFTCVKYKNAGKLSSHNWFFNGFCKELNPKFTILLDVGLKTDRNALYKMYTHMKEHPNVGGVCGFMRLKIEKVDEEEEIKEEQVDCLSSISLNLVDIQKAQQMEYNLSHIIEKPFESAIGFIHVLPGAFSGYNMTALRSRDGQEKLLKEYFRSIGEKVSDFFVKKSQFSLIQVIFRILVPQFIYGCIVGVDRDSEQQILYDSNVCLAQDRILCMEIHKNGYELIFLPDAFGQVDPMKSVHGLLGQRKRWMNGSLFAFDKVKRQMSEVDRCQCLLPMQIAFYNLINALAYFAIALFGYTFHISLLAFREDVLPQIIKDVPQDSSNSNNTGEMILNFFVYAGDFTYAMIVLSIIFFSVTTPANKPVYKPYIYFASTMFGLMTIMVFLVLFIDMIRGLVSDTAFLTAGSLVDKIVGGKAVLMAYRYMIAGLFGLFIIPIFIYSSLFCLCWPIGEVLKDVVSFLFYNTSYLILLTIYATARIDDISWGTKGLDSGGQKSAKEEIWKKIKLIILAKFVFWNAVITTVLISFANDQEVRFYLTFAIMGIIVLTIFIKVAVGAVYLFKYRLGNCCPQEFNETPKFSDLTLLAEKFKGELEPELLQRAGDVSNMMRKTTRYGRSVIMALQSYRTNTQMISRDQQRFNTQNIGRSKILQKKTGIQSRKESYKQVKLERIGESQRRMI